MIRKQWEIFERTKFDLKQSEENSSVESETDFGADVQHESRVNGFLSSIGLPQQLTISMQILQVTFSACSLKMRPARYRFSYSQPSAYREVDVAVKCCGLLSFTVTGC